MTQEKVITPEERKELISRIIKGELSDEEKQAILRRVQRKAAQLKYKHGGCGQTPFLPLVEEFDLPGGTEVFKSLTFTGYGLAAELGVCAALLGGFAALGLWAGRESLEDPIYPDPERIDETTGNPKTLERIRRFHDQFVEEFGGVSCREIQENLFDRVYELADPKEKRIFIEIYSADCAELVGKTARMTAETILDIPRRESKG